MYSILIEQVVGEPVLSLLLLLSLFLCQLAYRLVYYWCQEALSIWVTSYVRIDYKCSQGIIMIIIYFILDDRKDIKSRQNRFSKVNVVIKVE